MLKRLRNQGEGRSHQRCGRQNQNRTERESHNEFLEQRVVQVLKRNEVGAERMKSIGECDATDAHQQLENAISKEGTSDPTAPRHCRDAPRSQPESQKIREDNDGRRKHRGAHQQSDVLFEALLRQYSGETGESIQAHGGHAPEGAIGDRH